MPVAHSQRPLRRKPSSTRATVPVGASGAGVRGAGPAAKSFFLEARLEPAQQPRVQARNDSVHALDGHAVREAAGRFEECRDVQASATPTRRRQHPEEAARGGLVDGRIRETAQRLRLGGAGAEARHHRVDAREDRAPGAHRPPEPTLSTTIRTIGPCPRRSARAPAQTPG